MEYFLISDVMTLIWDINGPDAKKLREYILMSRLYLGLDPGCSLAHLGEGSNLTHKKEPYWYEYRFDAKVKLKCENKEEIKTCNFSIRVYINKLGIYDHPVCHNLPKIGSLKK